MKKLNHTNYLALRGNCKVIEQDGFGDKVMILQDGTFLKLFRRKFLIRSAFIRPYAQRFADNANKLEKLGITCPSIIQVYRIPSIKRDAVHYHPLPGTTLRDLYRDDLEYPADLRERFLKFVNHIQDLGVYFRSIHLGNVVLTPEGKMGLLDISDMKIFRRSLSQRQRKKNCEYIARNNNELEWLAPVQILQNFEKKGFEQLNRKVAKSVKKNSNTLYIKTLINFDCSITKIQDLKFIRFLNVYGKGSNSLNYFRAVTVNNELLFEKTYHTKSLELKNTLAFYKKLKLQKLNIKTPKIARRLSGSKISIVLFKFNPHKKIENIDFFLDLAICAIKDIAVIQHGNKSSEIYTLRCYRKALAFCEKNKLDITPIKKSAIIISKNPQPFAHADLNMNNISNDGTIYDWDTSGYYPLGYDLACIINISEAYKNQDILKLIIKTQEEIYHRYNSNDFIISTLFLTFALASNRKTKHKINLYELLKSRV